MSTSQKKAAAQAADTVLCERRKHRKISTTTAKYL